MADELPILNESAALENAAGDAELAKLLQSTCIEEAPKLIAEARKAMGEKDWKTARRCGHSLKSSFGAVGASAAAEQSEVLELLETDDLGQFDDAINAIESAFRKFASLVEA